jgi:hypothetical protein
MVGVSGSNKLSLYVIATEILMVQACVDQSHRRNAYCSTAVDQSYRRKAYCSAVPQRTICTLQQNSVRLYQVRLIASAVLPSSIRNQVQVPYPVIHTHVLQYSGLRTPEYLYPYMHYNIIQYDCTRCYIYAAEHRSVKLYFVYTTTTSTMAGFISKLHVVQVA